MLTGTKISNVEKLCLHWRCRDSCSKTHIVSHMAAVMGFELQCCKQLVASLLVVLQEMFDDLKA